MADSSFKLTYATMFNPPEEMHKNYEAAVKKHRKNLGKEYAMIINGKDVLADEKFNDINPANTDEVLGVFQKGSKKHADEACKAARAAFPKWSKMPWQERIALLRKAASLMDKRIYEIGAAISMEVGKNRSEALGDIAETVGLIEYACDSMEKAKGFLTKLGKDPLVGYSSTNYSHLIPYGVWAVISPFNFPAALTGGPMGAALVAGNTVVFKPATDTPWTSRLLGECLRDAGVPDGVYNFITGPGSTLGQALIDNEELDGITFTGSYEVGMNLYRDFGKRRWVRPSILELGGKNPVIVSRKANLEDAAVGIVRSAFGLQGQKCSAASRVFIEGPVYDELVKRIVDLTEKLSIGDPTDRKVAMGPVVNKGSYRDYQEFSEDLQQHSNILTGGRVLTDGAYAKGYFCTPTIAVDLPESHRLWKQEMFVPITTVAKIANLDEGMRRANDVEYGLTSGFYGSSDEVKWFFENIEAGVNYANRPQGATTGAWPGFQPFGGWKGSGSSGKNAGGPHYLQLYMHEKITTEIKHTK